MAVNRRSRRRSPRWILAAVGVTVVALLASASLHGHPSSTDGALAYYDQIRPEIQRSTNEGADLADLRTNALKLGRDGLTRGLDRLTADAGSTLAAVSATVPPPSLRVAHAYLVAALGVRSKASAEADTAMRAALSVGPPDVAINGLVAAGQDLELGDRAYQLFLGALPNGAGGVVVPPAPNGVQLAGAQAPPSTPLVGPSAWVSDDADWSQTAIGAFVTTLRSSTSLTPVSDMAVITFATEPPPVGVDNGAEVLPAAPMQVSIVVADVGNTPERHVTVTATLVTAGSNTTEMVRDFVDVVPGQRIALKIGSLHPVARTTGTLTIAVQPIPGESNLVNNTLQWAVEFR